MSQESRHARFGHSFKGVCPECMRKSQDQLWMEVTLAYKDKDETGHPYRYSQGVAWCPCSCIFNYELTYRWDSQLKALTTFILHGNVLAHRLERE